MLSAVVDLTISPYNSDGVSRIKVKGPDVVVTRDAGTTIALCLHELITNAIKYGSLSHADGHVEINWAITEALAPEFALDWVEIGGPAVREPTRQGYGTRYVRAALGSLFGNPPVIEFAPVGFRCKVTGHLARMQSPEKSS